MGLRSREKGASGEREFCQELSKLIGIECLERNLEQTRSGGHDLQIKQPAIELLPHQKDTLNHLNLLAIEIKRHRKATQSLMIDWWKQTSRQAAQINRSPMLAFREDRGRWQIVLPCSLNRPDSDILGTVRMDIELFAEHLMAGATTDLLSNHGAIKNEIDRESIISGFQCQL